MIKTFGNSWKRVIAIILGVVFLATPGTIGFAAAASSLFSKNVVLSAEKFAQGCPSCKNDINSKAVEYAKNMGLSTELVAGDEAQRYLGLFQSQGLSNLGEKLSVYKVAKVKPNNYVYVSGAFKEPMNDTILYAAINGNTDEVLMLKTVKYDGGDSVSVKDFLNNGAITSVSFKEINKSNEHLKQSLDEFMKKNDPGSVTTLIDWYSWCCSFAGILACGTGCAVFFEFPPLYVACDSMCNYFWSTGLCS